MALTVALLNMDTSRRVGMAALRGVVPQSFCAGCEQEWLETFGAPYPVGITQAVPA